MRITDTTYGSNSDGLIWGYRFVAGHRAQAISTEDLPALLGRTDDAQDFLWLHFSLSNQASERYMQFRHQIVVVGIEPLGHLQRVQIQAIALMTARQRKVSGQWIAIGEGAIAIGNRIEQKRRIENVVVEREIVACRR